MAGDKSATAVLHGRLVDCDSHLLPSASTVGKVLGAVGSGLARWVAARTEGLSQELVDGQRDRARRDPWAVREFCALGAEDPTERLEALDRMGIEKQVVLPPLPLPFLLGGRTSDEVTARRRWNDFVCDWASGTSGRLRPAVQIPTYEVEAAMTEARRCIARGASVSEVSLSRPPAGSSPAHPAWDCFWAMLGEARVAVVVHAGDGGGLGGAFPQADSLVDAAWGASPTLRPSALAPSPDPAGDFSAIGPFDVATLHLPVEVWLTALVLGGVLDRHPGLMIGVAEVGAQWIPSWIERLDRAGDPDAFRGLGLSPLPERPSAYVRRQVRVTPLYREPVGEYVATSGLREVYAFGSDYPHQEGGRDPVGRFGATFGRDTAAAKSFFVDNGLALLGN